MKSLSTGARPGGRGPSAALLAIAVAATLALLPGCTEEDLVKILETCPTDPADQGGIDWTPDVGAPVFYGHQDLTPADGAPRDMRVFYPSVDGSPPDAPILRRCIVRWPPVLFLHGQPPNSLLGDPDYHLRWGLLPAVLARSGYVVIVPSLNSQQIISDPAAARDAALADLDWVRTGWSEAEWVDKQSAAVAGHSLGGVLASFVAEARPDIGAMVTLSGDFLNGGRLGQVEAPSFFMWAHDLLSEDLDLLGTWNQLAMPRYRAVFQGEHFDYLRASDAGTGTPRGPCDLIGGVAADLAALFLSIHVPVPLARNRAGDDLQPPPVQLTQQQQTFAGGHLNSLDSFPDRSGCELDLKWDLNGTTGQRQIGG